MRRLLPLVLAPTIVLAACGDDSADPVAAPPDTAPDTAPDTSPPAPTTAPGAGGYELPGGADDVVVAIEYVGGFAPAEALFAQLPILYVTGDGRAFTQGPQILIYPGPLLPNVQVATLDEAGLQELAHLADQHGLLQDREYAAPTNIADAPDTVVTVRVGDATFVHRAYALGFDGTDTSGPRAELAAFVTEATALATGETTGYEPERFLVRAWPVTDLSGYDVEPTVIEWPVDVDLTGAGECVEIPAADIATTFADANQLTFFEQDGVIHQVAVKPALPGMAC